MTFSTQTTYEGERLPDANVYIGHQIINDQIVNKSFKIRISDYCLVLRFKNNKTGFLFFYNKTVSDEYERLYFLNQIGRSIREIPNGEIFSIKFKTKNFIFITKITQLLIWSILWVVLMYHVQYQT